MFCLHLCDESRANLQRLRFIVNAGVSYIPLHRAQNRLCSSSKGEHAMWTSVFDVLFLAILLAMLAVARWVMSRETKREGSRCMRCGARLSFKSALAQKHHHMCSRCDPMDRERSDRAIGWASSRLRRPD